MSTNITTFKVKPRQATKFVADVLQAGEVPYLEGSPGGFKSACFADIAKKINYKLIDHRLSTSDPTDLNGMPNIDSAGYAYFAPFKGIFPVEGTPLPKDDLFQDDINPTKKTGEHQYKGFLLFLDELPSAPREVQAAAFKLVLDRIVGQHPLHKKCLIGAAGNLMSDRSIVNALSTAMQSRLIHFELELDATDWLTDFAFPHKLDPRICGYVAQNPQDITDFRPDHKDKTFTCPRTWDKLNNILKVYSKRNETLTDSHLPIVAGAIGSGMALKFMAYAQVWTQLVTVAQVLADPNGTPVPPDAAVRYATVSMLMQHVNNFNFKDISTYVDRFDAGFRVLFYRMLIMKQPMINTHPDWGNVMVFLSQNMTTP